MPCLESISTVVYRVPQTRVSGARFARVFLVRYCRYSSFTGTTWNVLGRVVKLLAYPRLYFLDTREAFYDRVHPDFSEASHRRSSAPHPKTDFSKTQAASRGVIPWAKYTMTPFIFRNRLAIPTILG